MYDKSYRAYYYNSILPLNFTAFNNEHAIKIAKAFEAGEIKLKCVYEFDIAIQIYP